MSILSREPTTADDLPPDGEIVWHYTNGPGLISMLSSHTLWATSAAFLNDKSEVALGGIRMVERITQLAERDKTGLFAEFADKVRDNTSHGEGPSPASFHILSASQHWDSLAMWRCYGGQQESYALGLDATHPLAVLTKEQTDLPAPTDVSGLYLSRRGWQPVRYREQDQAELVDLIFDDLPEQIAAIRPLLVERPDLRHEDVDLTMLPPNVQEIIAAVLDDLEQALLLIKHEGFSDERETRASIVFRADGRSSAAREYADQLMHYRSTAYGIAPYLKLTGQAPDETRLTTPTASLLPIRAVAISPSPNGHSAYDSVRDLLRSNGYGDLPVLRSRIPFRG